MFARLAHQMRTTRLVAVGYSAHHADCPMLFVFDDDSALLSTLVRPGKADRTTNPVRIEGIGKLEQLTDQAMIKVLSMLSAILPKLDLNQIQQIPAPTVAWHHRKLKSSVVKVSSTG